MDRNSIAFFCNGATLFGLAVFVPTVINSLGYSPIRTQLFTVPPYAVSTVCSLIGALVADRYKCRGYVAVFFSIVAIAGYAMYLDVDQKSTHVLYGAIFLQYVPLSHFVLP